MPDVSSPFTLGLKNGKIEGFDGSIDPLAFANLRFYVSVGSHDTEQDESFNMSLEITHVQGFDRVERAKNWVKVLSKYIKDNNTSGRVEFYIQQGVGHSFRQSMVDKNYRKALDQFFFSQD